MTQEQDSQEQGDQAEVEATASGLDALTARLSLPGELMVAIGAIVVLAVDVLGDIILEEYSIGSVAWVLALLVLITIAAHRWGDLNLFGNYGRALMVLGVLGGALAAREIFDDARFDYLDGGTKTLFAVLYYVAGALMLVGAWQYWSSETDEDGN